jgi:hypothetical protein
VLLRFLGEERPVHTPAPKQHRVTIPPPDRPSPVPPEAEGKDDWIWIGVEDATPTTVTLGVLRRAASPIPAGDVIEQVQRLRSEIPSGTVANLGTRFSGEGLISRTDSGWTLVDKTRAPVLCGNHLWGPVSVLTPQDLAAHRRDSLLHLLRGSPSGLQIVQMVSMLEGCRDWMRAPITKDLVKVDMQRLDQDGLVKRVGNTRKWRVQAT